MTYAHALVGGGIDLKWPGHVTARSRAWPRDNMPTYASIPKLGLSKVSLWRRQHWRCLENLAAGRRVKRVVGMA